jgi:hypothetical protein
LPGREAGGVLQLVEEELGGAGVALVLQGVKFSPFVREDFHGELQSAQLQ